MTTILMPATRRQANEWIRRLMAAGIRGSMRTKPSQNQDPHTRPRLPGEGGRWFTLSVDEGADRVAEALAAGG